MKNTILTFVILFCSNTLIAQTSSPGGKSYGYNTHDSLLFDGSTREVFLNKGGDKYCRWKVKAVWGKVIGTRDTIIHEELSECDPEWAKHEGAETIGITKRGPMKAGDEVYDNDDLEMEGDAFIQLETNINDVLNAREYPYKMEAIHDNPFSNPYIIITAKCKNFKVPSCGEPPKQNYGNGTPDWDKVPLGDWYFDRNPGAAKYGRKFLFQSSGPKYNIHTDQCIIKNNGTMYSIEQSEAGDIIRVYEGSVEVTPLKVDDTKMKKGIEEINKLTEDYTSGKISLEEYKKKVAEGSDEFKKESELQTNNITIDAGYQCKVGENLREKTPIDSNDDRWWEKWKK